MYQIYKSIYGIIYKSVQLLYKPQTKKAPGFPEALLPVGEEGFEPPTFCL